MKWKDEDWRSGHRNTASLWTSHRGGFWGQTRVDEDPVGGKRRPGGENEGKNLVEKHQKEEKTWWKNVKKRKTKVFSES